MNTVMKYIHNILISIDQFVNVLFGGDPDETISSRVYKLRYRNIIPAIINWFLELIDPGHGKRSVEMDEGKDTIK